MIMTALPAHRYQFNCRVLEPLKLGFYAGSMLRGAFGKALRKTVCVTHMKSCDHCLLLRQCTYPKLFETPATPSQFQTFSDIPHPYVLEPPPLGERQLTAGDRFSFNLVLVGQAISALPLVIFAVQAAMKNGLGPGNAKAELLDVVFEPDQAIAQTIYSTADPTLHSAPAFMPSPLVAQDTLTLELTPPLRLQHHGQLLAATMTGKDFLMALVRRYYLLQEFHGEHYQPPDFKALSKAAAGIVSHNRFRWCEWTRYSNRQQQKMAFRGVLGQLTLSGDLAPFLSLLAQGQWLHVGTKTTFGMGGYRIVQPLAE